MGFKVISTLARAKVTCNWELNSPVNTFPYKSNLLLKTFNFVPICPRGNLVAFAPYGQELDRTLFFQCA